MTNHQQLPELNHTDFIFIDDDQATIDEHGGNSPFEKSVLEDQIPVVILEGSDGCCDLLTRCYRLYNKYYSKLEKISSEDSSTNHVVRTEKT
jgi:hypothetical protein